MMRRRTLFTAAVSIALGGACPGTSTPPASTATAITTTAATTTATAATGATPMPLPTTPLPTDAVRPVDSDAFRLVQSIVALGDGPWSPSALLGQPGGDLPRRDLRGPTARPTPPITPLVLPTTTTLPRQFQGLGKEVAMAVGDLTLTFTMQDGSWEPSTGNSERRMDEPIVIGITLTGPGGLTSPAPADAIATEVMADATGAATATTTALVWGRSLSFEQGSIERPFMLTRFVGRAPFQYSPAEHRALEDALIAITTALKEPIDVVDLVAARHGDRRVSADSSVYDFGAGTLTVQEQGIGVQLVGPMRLPRLFAAHGVTTLRTSFAHNRGQMPATIHGAGFDLFPGVYTFDDDGRRRGREAQMGEAALARLSSLAIGVKPRQIGDVGAAAPSRR